ncbi:PREDICTED: spondin-1 isoform X2 [Nicrophorus vespilloides]|uniref:Spondin-1 n=1 Tax=Nicrophorus vespilloides TaxID=110193 RepID=A0ABM1MBW9_NICVS|nr:PREDICTED: spondin-1 isoform X2 [Nicrophorus vespilloides]
MRLKVAFLWLVSSISWIGEALRCDRTPEGTFSPRTRADGRFVIEVSGNPDTYVPGEQYNIFLRSNGEYQAKNKFKDFLLLVEHEPSEKILGEVHNPSVGTLQLLGDMLMKFSEKCRNAVMQTNSLPKSEVQVLWVAPPSGSGCVAIRATVVESKEFWYTDDGPLSKILCEEVQENEDTQPNMLRQCCACDEAKYEVTFEGLWSRNTHPKDFPSNGWLTRFSDIIGASHTFDYTFWNYGEIASNGLRQLAENGNTRMLESELKAKSEHIRTIIKARGISYPNITGKTFAVFRVDKRHHLMSLVSMIDPSPDWIVGVSGLELCLRNCSWVESRVLNLYPWDAGTDDGPTYISANQPSMPPHPIRRIKSNSPNDPRSPFYDPTGTEMKPLARLYLSRQRLYEKNCVAQVDVSEEDGGVEGDKCEMEEWSEWSKCTVTCGRGFKYKQRAYKNPASNFVCNKPLTKRASCVAILEHCSNQQRPQEADPSCSLTGWGNWSSCTAPCGPGWKTRSRRYKNRKAAKRCAAGNENPEPLEQNLECMERECGPSDRRPLQESKECEGRAWSNWSPCSSTCGKGIKVRRRMAYRSLWGRSPARYNRGLFDTEDTSRDDDDDGSDEDPCMNLDEKVECINDDVPVCEDTVDNSVTENYFGRIVPGSQTRQDQDKKIIQEPIGEVVDCQMSEWTNWSGCNATCGRGFSTKHRFIRVHPSNGGKRCPQKILKKRKCKIPCPGDYTKRDPMLPTWGTANSLEHVQIDCVMTGWSAWSPCSRSCGPNAVQQRTRGILLPPSGRGEPCLHRTEERPCSLLACPE